MISQKSPHLLLTLILAMVMVGAALSILPFSALGESKPDLTLDTSDIHFSDSEPEEGDDITIYATITNQGDGNASDIYIVFKDYYHGDGKESTIGNRTIRTLGSGHHENVSIIWNADPAGNHTIKVLIDPIDNIDEDDESNNNAQHGIIVKKGGGQEKTILKGYTKKESDGAHLPEVTIYLSKGDFNTNTTSDGNGWYEFELDEGGMYHIRAVKHGYKDYEANVSLKNGEEKTYHIYMESEQGDEDTKVYGYVYQKESRGTPIENATITITSNSHNESHTTYTDRHGYYEKVLSRGGNYTIKAEKDGYKPETKHTIIAEGESERVDFHLEKEGGSGDTILKGYTKEKSNSTHIPNVSVRVSKGNYSQTMKSDGNGYYEFTLDEGGTYHVTAQKDGYKDYSINVSVQEGKETTRHIYMDRESGSEKTKIYGYVREKGTNHSIEDAKVTISPEAQNESYTVYTDRNGYYTKELSSGGNYTVIADKKEGYKSETKHVFIEEGEHKQLDFYLEKEGGSETTKIYGYVREKGANNSIEHAEVTITGNSHNESHTVYTDHNGYYIKELSSGGNYTVTADKDGYESQTRTVHIKDGEHRRLDLYLQKKAGDNKTILKGYAKDANDSTRIPNVKIIVTNSNDNWTEFSDNNGYYEFSLEGEGIYHIVAQTGGYETFHSNISLEGGSITTYHIYLEKEEVHSAMLIGYVKDKSDNSPLPHVDVTITGNECDCTYTVTTDAMGYYEVELSMAGNYTVVSEKDGYNSHTRVSYIKANDTTIVNFHLARIVTKINGHVWEGATRGRGIKGALVIITQLQNRHYSAYTDGFGYYEQELEGGGSYHISVSLEGYQPANDSVTLKTGELKTVNFFLTPTKTEKPAKERFGVDVEASKRTVDLQGKNQTILIITVENLGIETDSYSLTITGSYKGWKASFDSPDTITLEAGEVKNLTLTLSEDLTESPDGDTIVVEVVVRSKTYPDIYDSARIEGKLEESNEIPDLTIPLIATSLGAGALVAFFRRRN